MIEQGEPSPISGKARASSHFDTHTHTIKALSLHSVLPVDLQNPIGTQLADFPPSLHSHVTADDPGFCTQQ